MGLKKTHIMCEILVAHLLKILNENEIIDKCCLVSSWQLFEMQVHCAWNACPVPIYIVQLTTKICDILFPIQLSNTITTSYNFLQFYISFAALVLKIFGAYSRCSRSKYCWESIYNLWDSPFDSRSRLPVVQGTRSPRKKQEIGLQKGLFVNWS